MSESRLELEQELLLTSTKTQMINKYIDELEENEILTKQWLKTTQELERYKNIIKSTKEEIELYINTTIDHLETNNEEINFELRNKCRAMREIKSEILEIIEKELKGE